MTPSDIRRVLLRRWPFSLGVVVLAVVLAIVVKSSLAGVPTGQATTQILVDSPKSALVNANVNSAGLEAQAGVLAQAMTSQAVLESIANAGHVPVGAVTAEGPFSGAGQVLDIPTPSEARGSQLVALHQQYHLAFVAQLNIPIITVSVTGPDPQAAGEIANAVLPGTKAWLSTIAAAGKLPVSRQIVLRQLGDAQAGSVNSKTPLIEAVVAAAAILILGLLAVVLGDRSLDARRRRRGSAPQGASDPSGTPGSADSARATRERRRRRPTATERAKNGPSPMSAPLKLGSFFDRETGDEDEDEDGRAVARNGHEQVPAGSREQPEPASVGASTGNPPSRGRRSRSRSKSRKPAAKNGASRH